jgi:hypothetical protein
MAYYNLTEAEFKAKVEKERGMPVVSCWHRHKETGLYSSAISIFEMNNYEEVEE